MRARVAAALAAVFLGLFAPTSALAAESDTDIPAEPTPSTVVNESFSSSDIDGALVAADGDVTAQEQSAVDSYLTTEDPDNLLDDSDVRVGTLESDAITVTVVAPSEGVDVDGVTVGASAPDSLTMGASLSSDGSTPASATGPTMGTWPSWTSSWNASVELRLYYYDDYLGSATFQTYKRQFQNDQNTDTNYFEVARHAVAVPATWNSYGLNGAMRVKKLWASQALDGYHRYAAKQWNWARTEPDNNDQICNNPNASIGPWSIGYTNCTDYDVWLGTAGDDDIGHERMSMDQGSVVNGGTRSLACVSSYSLMQSAGTGVHVVRVRHPDQARSRARCTG